MRELRSVLQCTVDPERSATPQFFARLLASGGGYRITSRHLDTGAVVGNVDGTTLVEIQSTGCIKSKGNKHV